MLLECESPITIGRKATLTMINSIQPEEKKLSENRDTVPVQPPKRRFFDTESVPKLMALSIRVCEDNEEFDKNPDELGGNNSLEGKAAMS